MSADPLSIAAIEERTDRLIALDDRALREAAPALSAELLAMGEHVLEAWLVAHGKVPTQGRQEGFRLLALHRQGARGDPSFNACRETCREIVYHHNVTRLDPAAEGVAGRIRLGAMVVRHLALFVGGKLEVAGLGEFCCSSRGLRMSEAKAPPSRTA